MPERPSKGWETLPRWEGKLETRGRLHGCSDRLAPEPALLLLGDMELRTGFELMRQTFRLYYQWLCFVLCFYFFLAIDLTVIDNTYGTLWAELYPPQNTHDEVLTPVSQAVTFMWRQNLYQNNQAKMKSFGWALVWCTW